jgi:hypothetical protein
MASRNKNERAYANALVKAIQKNSSDVYVYVDRDAGSVRHTSSGFDFLLASQGCVVFCEAKIENGKLTDWQKFIRVVILATGTPYFVVRFWESGVWFSIDSGTPIRTEKATITDFIK